MATTVRSDLHRRLRRLGAAWLFREQRALVVCEELMLGGGRVADIVGMSDAKRVMPWTEAARENNPELTRLERRRKDGRPVEVPMPTEFRAIEVKASRADFLVGVRKGQISNENTGLGNRSDYCYVLSPWGIVMPEDLPPKWGLLWWWEGPSQKLYWCTSAHEGNSNHQRRKTRIKLGAADELVAYLGKEVTHVHTAKANAYHTLEGQVRNHLVRVQTAYRLTPKQPLSTRGAIVKAAMIQSNQWRLYGNVDYEEEALPLVSGWAGPLDDLASSEGSSEPPL